MAHTPRIATLKRKQLRTRQVKHLPPVKPPTHITLPVRLLQMRPDLLLLRIHLPQPVLTGLGVVLPADPPLLRHLQIALEVEEQVGRGHCAAGEEVGRHPARVEVVG